MNAIILLGGSQLQAPIIEDIIDLDLKLLLTDQNENSPLRKDAAEFLCISATDHKRISQEVKIWSKNYNIVAVYCGNDFGLHTVSIISQQLGLTFHTQKAIDNSLNKLTATILFEKENLGIPKTQLYDSNLENKNLTFPIIVKPIDSSGSRGITQCDTVKSLSGCIEHAKKFSKTVLLQEVIVGNHIDVNGIMIDDKFYPCGIYSRHFSPPPYQYPIMGLTPPDALTEEREHNIYKTLESGARALGLSQGPVKGDFIEREGINYILEISPRFHGDIGSSFLGKIAYNTVASTLWIKFLSTGLKPVENLFKANGNYAGWGAILPRAPGILEKIENTEQVLKQHGIIKIILRRECGFEIKEIKNNLAVLGFVLGKSHSYQEIKDRLLKAQNTLSVITRDLNI